MSTTPKEYCYVCNESTGKAGRGEDSIYDLAGNGPYCEMCYSQTEEYRREIENETKGDK